VLFPGDIPKPAGNGRREIGWFMCHRRRRFRGKGE
jgi:hypothetical protein